MFDPVRLILFMNADPYIAWMHVPLEFRASSARSRVPARATCLLSLIAVFTVISCGQLDMALFPTDDWSTVFPARVKTINVPSPQSNEVGETGQSWMVQPLSTSALAVYDCSTLCHIVIGSVTCQTAEGREAPCVVRLVRESCLIGARTKQKHEDIVQVTCSEGDVDSSRMNSTGRFRPRSACVLDMNVPGHSSPIPCPSLLLAPMKPAF
jgi:hypothetical protein